MNNVGELTTTTLPLSNKLKTAQQGTAHWLAEQLDYKVRFDIPTLEDKEFKVEISPFSRQVTLLLESYLDELIEQEWLDLKFA